MNKDNFFTEEVNFFERNPRYLTLEARDKLEKLTKELGDISGIVIDVNSKQFIGGNQRSLVLGVQEAIREGKVQWVQSFDPPTPQGTVRLGFVVDERTGERFSIRLVNWTAEQCNVANLAANFAGGETDTHKLFQSFDSETILSVFHKSRLEGLQVSGDAQNALRGLLNSFREGQAIPFGSSSDVSFNEIPEPEQEDSFFFYDSSADLEESQVKMLQLYLTVSTHAEVMSAVEAYRNWWSPGSPKSVTDIIYQMLKEYSEILKVRYNGNQQ